MRIVSLDHLTVFELEPPELVLTAALAGFTHAGMRLNPAAPGGAPAPDDRRYADAPRNAGAHACHRHPRARHRRSPAAEGDEECGFRARPRIGGATGCLPRSRQRGRARPEPPRRPARPPVRARTRLRAVDES